MDMMRRSTLSTPLTLEFVKPNWLKFTPQTPPDTHYSPRYSIPQFPLERIMVNVLLYRCCAAQINSSRKSGRGAVMQPFVKRSIKKEGWCSCQFAFMFVAFVFVTQLLLASLPFKYYSAQARLTVAWTIWPINVRVLQLDCPSVRHWDDVGTPS